MIGEIFRVNHEGNFVPTNQAMGIPEFKNLWDKVPNPEIYFLYIHYMLFPVSLYSEVPESEKEEMITKDYPVDKTNPYFIIAYKKAEKLYETPLKRGFLAAKTVYEIMSSAMQNINSIGLTFGRDGNYADITSFLKNSQSFMDSYIAVESRYKEEINGWGSRDIGFDDTHDYVTSNIELN
jgi:hypothetical protein